MLVVALLGFVFVQAISAAFDAALDSLPNDWALITGEYFVHVLTTPLLGMGIAVLYDALVDREPARTRNEPAEAGSS